MNPWGYNPFGPPKSLLLALGATSICVGFSFDASLLNDVARRLRRSAIAIAAAVLLGLLAISTAASVDVRQSVVGSYPEYQGFLAVVFYVVVAVGAAALVIRGDPRAVLTWFARSVSVTVLLVSLYALLQRSGLDFMHYRSELPLIERVSSTLGNASNLGVYLLLALPFVLERLRCEGRPAWRALAAAAALTGGLALMWSYSRGAWLGALAAAALAGMLAVRASKTRAWAGLGVRLAGGLLVAVALLALVWPTGIARVRSSLDPTKGTARWRILVWRSAIDMAARRPLVGWGPATFRFVYPSFRARESTDGKLDVKSVDDAHNIVVNTAATAGIPAAVALVGLLVLAARQALRTPGSGPRAPADAIAPSLAMAAACVGPAVALQFHFLTLDTGPWFFSVVAVLAVLEAESAQVSAGAADGYSKPPGRALRNDEQHLRGRLSQRLALAVALLGALLGCAAVAATAGLLVADGLIGRGFQALHQDRGWAAVQASMAGAQRAAPWEPAFSWATGQASMEAMSGGFDAAVFAAGERAMRETRRRVPLDPRVPLQYGDLVLTAGLKSGRRALFEQAFGLYRQALARDPNNALCWIGMGSSAAGLGDWTAAIADYEKAIGLAPRADVAWSNLAIAYRAVGRAADAREAQATAKAIRKGMPASPLP